MKLRMLAKDGMSGTKACPSVYVAEDGSFVVQGRLLDDDTYGQLDNMLAGEGAVRISPEVILDAAARYQAGS